MNRPTDATTTTVCPQCGGEFVHLLTRRRVWCSSYCRDDALGRMPRPDHDEAVSTSVDDDDQGDVSQLVLDLGALTLPPDNDDDDDPPAPRLTAWPAHEWFR